jgi:hypothetical protein
MASALLVLSITASAADAATLTSKNSVVAQFPFAEYVEARAPDCATAGIGVIPAPADALSVNVASPKVGANLQGVRVTAVDAAAPGFSITFNAEPSVCDPVINDYPPGTVVPWNIRTLATGTYDRRVAACLRPYFDKYSSKKCKVRPRKVFTGIEGIERGFREFYYGINWKSFGGRKASGRGKYKQECATNGRCAPAKKVRIVADKPKLCGDSKSVEYTRLTSYSGGKLWFRQRLVC